MERKNAYPSNISGRQFEPIALLLESVLLESVHKRTKPRTVDLHEVFNAVLYLFESGCLCRVAETVGRRTMLRMVGKVPRAIEELRTQAEYQPANDPPAFLVLLTQEIVNRR